MRLLRYLAGIFIDTFGITHPSPFGRNRAARYIAFLIAAMLFLLGCAIALAVHTLHI